MLQWHQRSKPTPNNIGSYRVGDENLITNKFGYYQVGDEIITNKVKALLRASQVGIHPTWHFHDDVYRKLDWTRDTSLDLNTLYQMRARQLRDKYDYLCLNFSGGSDSWTALKSFKDAGIWPDEIFTRWPFAATHGRYHVNSDDLRPSNIFSEWYFTVEPVLREIEEWFPHTKITVHDWSTDFFSNELSDDLWLDCMPSDYLNPGAIFKNTAMSEGEKQAIESGKKTALIVAIDKPHLFYKDGMINCFFLDKLANGHVPEINGRNGEHFYWTPDLPEITLTQARMIYRALQSNNRAAINIDASQLFDINKKHLWDMFVRPIIYPEYMQRGIWQTKKCHTRVYDHADFFMFNYETKYLQSWNNVFANIINSIDEKYIDRKNGEITGFKGFFDGVYALGPLEMRVSRH